MLRSPASPTPRTESSSARTATSATAISYGRRLTVVATGNISNDDLLALFDQHLHSIVAALDEARFVELGPDRLIVHQDR
jgi:hypothetical protein